MPTFTVSATGGNWSNTATWVGGILPAAGDDIVANASSGPLTVDSNRTCLTITFTGYTNTFTINNGVTLNVTGNAITLGSGMIYNQGTTGVLSTISNSNLTITFAGITIPRLTIGRTAGNQTQTVTISGTTPTIQNLVVTNGFSTSTTTLAGTGVTITNSFTNTLGSLTGTLLTFSGTCTITTSASATVANGFTVTTGSSLQLLSALNINGGTITFSGTATLNPGTNTLFLTGTGAKILNTSTVNWWNVTNNTQTALVQLLSNLNITNNLSFTNTFGSGGCGFSGNFNVNVGGSLFLNDLGAGSITFTGGGSINMIGTGTIRATSTGTSVLGCTLNINTTNPLGYIFGDASFPILRIGSGGVLNLQGTSVASVYSPTGHTLHMTLNSILNTNNTPTGANLPGGTEILWGNLTCTPTGTQTVTISQQTIFQGNLTTNVAFVIFAINGAKIIVYGNLSGIDIRGTSEIELGGSGNANWSTGSYQNNITINKSSGGVVNLSGTITWGAAGRTLQRTAGNINPGTSTISIPASISVTINNMVFWNLSLAANVAMIQNAPNTIQSTLGCSGNTTFQGTHGWTTSGFSCTAAASIITLQNINANPLAEYRITGSLNIIGTLANRIVLQAAGRVSFTGGIASAVFPSTTSVMTTTGGPALLTGMTVSQATGQAPTGLSNLFPNRPVITSGAVNTWNLNANVNPAVVAGTALAAGFKAKFILEEGALQNVIYARTEDIDSSNGQTILSFGSNQDNVSSNVSLFRTLNWGSLIAPTGSVAYTFVN